MSEIIYTKDETIDESLPKPDVFDIYYPYNNLSSRNFEVLCYLVYKNEIQFGDWTLLYSDISLMQGVRDKGRDCCLIKDGKNRGIIQCKNYNKPLLKEECSKEILKFLFHYFLDRSLIDNIKNFSYYLVAPNGFNDEATDLLNNFNEKIIKELNFKKWVDFVLKDNVAFGALLLKNIEEEFYELLRSIKVYKIIGPDIDVLLNKPENIFILKKFFSLRSVIETDLILDKLEGYFGKVESFVTKTISSEIPVHDLLTSIEIASHYLFDYSNSFSDDQIIHIERSVVTELFEWLKTPLEKIERLNNIALLSGNAGMGKSVVMKDLCEKLKKELIPVLGIKADRYYADNLDDLQKKLNLSDAIDKSIKKLSEQHSIVVICIDQIDALSQSLSSKRDYMVTFDSLISSLRFIDNVRIIISTRTYDLKYDPSLQYYKDQKIFELGPLKIEELESVLSKADISSNQLHANLKALIRTPNELSVFLRIYNSQLPIDRLNSLYDLYNELWKQKIKDADIKSLLFSISSKMYDSQTISISEQYFINESKNIEYCKRENLINLHEGLIQFFHQTFYDYVYARNFIESNQSVEKYIIHSNNSIFIRSCLKMILAFLSINDHKKYINTVEKILYSNKYRFHLKLLIIQSLGIVEKPTLEENSIIKKLYNRNRWMFKIFVESVISSNWLLFLIKDRYIDMILLKKGNPVIDFLDSTIVKKSHTYNNAKNRFKIENSTTLIQNNQFLVLELFLRHIPKDRSVILQYLTNCPEFDNKINFIFRVICRVEIFDNKLAYDLTNTHKEEYKKDTFWYLEILDHALLYNSEWAIKLIEEFLLERISISEDENLPINDHHHYEYQIGQFFEKASKQNKICSFNSGIEIILKCIDCYSYEHVYKKGVFYSDRLFSEASFHDKDLQGYARIYQVVIKLVKDIALCNPNDFKLFYYKHKSTCSISLVILISKGLQSNYKFFLNEVIDFIEILQSKDIFLIHETKLDYELRYLIEISYPYLSSKKQEFINDIILNIVDPYELGYKENKDVKVFSGGRFYGLHKYSYLLAIPVVEMKKHLSTYKIFQELQRKFPNHENKKPKRTSVLRGGYSPVSQKAIEHFSFSKWIENFKKFSTDSDEVSNGRSVVEFARSFAAEVALKPEYYFSLINEIVNYNDIALDYVINGIDGLIQAKYNPEAVALVFKKAIKRKANSYDIMRLIYHCNYLIEHEKIDNEIFEFLKWHALNNEDPIEDKDGSLRHAINTVRGSAISKLTRLFNYEFWQNDLLDIAEKVANDKVIAVRVSLLSRLAYLMNIDKERTLKIFLLILSECTNEVLDVAGWSAQYLSFYNFEALKDYFYKSISADTKDSLASAITILVHRWSQGFEGSSELLELGLKKSEKAQAIALQVACHNLIENEILDKRNAELYNRFLINETKDLVHEYSVSFLRFKARDFKLLYPLISNFALSPIGQKGVNYYFEYLYSCIKQYPRECLDLIFKIKDFNKLDTRYRVDKDNPIQVIVGAYNRIYNDSQNDPYLVKALDKFDSLLKMPQYRLGIGSILENVEN